MSDEKRHLVKAGKAPSQTLSHPLNENSEIKIEIVMGDPGTEVPAHSRRFAPHT